MADIDVIGEIQREGKETRDQLGAALLGIQTTLSDLPANFGRELKAVMSPVMAHPSGAGGGFNTSLIIITLISLLSAVYMGVGGMIGPLADRQLSFELSMQDRISKLEMQNITDRDDDEIVLGDIATLQTEMNAQKANTSVQYGLFAQQSVAREKDLHENIRRLQNKVDQMVARQQ